MSSAELGWEWDRK